MTAEEIAINHRFIDVYHALKKRKAVKNKSDFSSKLEMPLAYFSFFEKEERSVPGQYTDKVCELFNISKDWLLFGVGGMFKAEQEKATNTITGNNNSGNQWSGGNMSYGTSDQRKELENMEKQNALMAKELEGLRKEIELYKKMISLLEGK